MIVTLAGHVDHGKTAIVRALTGVDTDRLEEEKRRGLTIDLGFAYADFEGARVGFVDVPGHHRFIHNMVAGIGRRQFGLLVVAADDGVMPQTREHLQILQLIGLQEGVVAVNKIDRVDAERIQEVRLEVEGLVLGSFLEGAAMVEVSSIDGCGVDELRTELANAARRHAVERADRGFRLAVDRAFSVRGAGVVVTGTVVAGSASVGGALLLAASDRPLRVRGLHVQNATADTAHEGDRTAMNLTGLEVDDVARGDWIVAPSAAGMTRYAVVDFDVLPDFPRALRHWAPVHAYVATSHAQGRVSLLDGAPIAPGAGGPVDIVLDRPLPLKVGDRLIARDQDLGRTIGGGRVIDVAAAHGRRRAGARLDRIQALRDADPEHALVALAARGVVEAETFRRDWNLTTGALARAVERDELVRRGNRVIHRDLLAATRDAVLRALADHHRIDRESAGMAREAIARALGGSAVTVDVAIESLGETGDIRAHAGSFALASHVAEIPTALAALFDRVSGSLDTLQPPSLGDIAKFLGRPFPQLEREMRALAGIGLCEQVGPNRFYLTERLREMAEVAVRLDAEGGFTVRQFRDASGVGRNVVIEVLEHFDRKGFTRRSGDTRRVVGEVDRVGN